VGEVGIDTDKYEEEIPRMVMVVEGDTSVITATRIPNRADTEKILRYAYAGKTIDF
jgi:hypothetical protein